MRKSAPTAPRRGTLFARELPALGRSLSPADAALPLGHLQLKARARAIATSFPTISHLLQELERAGEFAAAWTPTMRKDLADALHVLGASLLADGRVDWATFTAGRPAFLSEAMYYTDHRYRFLSAQERTVSLARLGLRVKTLNSLGRADIRTVGRLIEHLKRGLRKLPRANARASADLRAALRAMGESIGKDGKIDWARYAAARGFAILPKKEIASLDEAELITLLPHLVKQILRRDFDPRYYQVIQRRYLVPRRERQNFRQLGASMKCCGFRSALIQAEVLAALRRIFFQNDYRNSTVYIRENLTRPLRTIARQLRPGHLGPIEGEAWETLTQERWGKAVASLPVSRFFLPVLLGLNVRWRSKASLIGETRRTINSLIHSRNGISLTELRAEVERRFGKRRLEQVNLPQLLAGLSRIHFDDGRYRAGILNTVHTTQCAALLRLARHPVHIHDLWRAYQAQSPGSSASSPAVLGAAMSRDKQRRFVCMGKSGFWGLIQWSHFESGMVPDAAAALLGREKNALSIADIHTQLLRSRRVSRGYLLSKLCEDCRFRRTPEGLWTLAKKAKQTSATAE